MFARIRQLRKDNQGATAIEFAFVALPLIWLMLAIIEYGVLMATQSVLEGATSKAARMYKAEARTNNAGAAANSIRNRIAQYSGGLVRPGRLRVIAQQVTWGDAPGFGATPNSNTGRAGRTGDVIQYRAFYTYRVHTPVLGRVLGANTFRLVASTVVQNEPSIGGGSGV